MVYSGGANSHAVDNDISTQKRFLRPVSKTLPVCRAKHFYTDENTTHFKSLYLPWINLHTLILICYLCF